MSGRRRRRGRGSSGGGGQRAAQQRNRQRTESSGPGFWGDPSRLPDAEKGIRVTDDPHAVPRSLGEPPLPQQREIAEHYFALVYERAVMTARAVAAAGGLIELEEVADED